MDNNKGERMPLLDLIRERRSVRRFDSRLVERAKLELCLEAARLAPSACNSQPWRLVVVDEYETKTRLASAAFSGIYSGSAFAGRAPVIVAAVADRAGLTSRTGSLVRNTSFHLIDMGICGEHFVLQAAELGMGTCWIGWFNERGVKSVLGIPVSRRVEYLLAVGYADGGVVPAARQRLALAEMSSFNAWRES
jgi:nitroreductase